MGLYSKFTFWTPKWRFRQDDFPDFNWGDFWVLFWIVGGVNYNQFWSGKEIIHQGCSVFEIRNFAKFLQISILRHSPPIFPQLFSQKYGLLCLVIEKPWNMPHWWYHKIPQCNIKNQHSRISTRAFLNKNNGNIPLEVQPSFFIGWFTSFKPFFILLMVQKSQTTTLGCIEPRK